MKIISMQLKLFRAFYAVAAYEYVIILIRGTLPLWYMADG